jgi:glycosyltransferase involved in cell wall biosynthesis
MKNIQTKGEASFKGKGNHSIGRSLVQSINDAEWSSPSLASDSLSSENAFAVNFVAFKMGHHAGRSGYDRIMDYINGAPIIGSSSPTFSERVVAKLLKQLVNRSGSVWYHRANLLAELHAAQRWWRQSRQVFHFLYGENSFRHLGQLKRFHRRHTIVATYHTPSWRLQELVTKPAHISGLDAAVVVSRVQQPFFERLLGPERTFFIPHGIDTDYFMPIAKEEVDRPFRCIFVGSHLRDFETLMAAAPMLCKGTQLIELVVVTQRDNYHFFSGLRNVELHSGLADDELRNLYGSADLLLLPLLDCTANNALLEGMACGLPVVATDLAGVRDYCDNKCGILTPRQDPKALAEAVLSLSEQPELCKKMGIASRQAALRFAWPKVAAGFMSLYANVSN